MSARTRRRRAAALLLLALACGGVAASEVGDRIDAVERQVGSPVPVVVAAHDLEPGSELRRRDLRVAHVPRRFAPPDAPTAPEQAVGLRTAGPVVAGSPITAGVVGADAGAAPGALRRGERALEIAAAGGAALTDTAGPGTRVDVLVSTEPGDRPGRTFVALEDVELLALRPFADPGLGGDIEPVAGAASALATVRVTTRQAVYLTAANSFATEIRLLPRPAGDRRRVGRASFSADGL
ncbi:MAG: Flp pilus assembly protein CpaB [Thermoleophilaceae bacterium]